MVQQYYFLNGQRYKNKDGVMKLNLTVCDSNGEVTQFFADADKYVEGLKLFDIINVDFSLQRFGKNLSQVLNSYEKSKKGGE